MKTTKTWGEQKPLRSRSRAPLHGLLRLVCCELWLALLWRCWLLCGFN